MPVIDSEPFATAEDVGVWLGRALTEAEEAQADAVLQALADLIREAAEQEAEWTPDPTPPLFVSLSIRKAIQVITNPHGLAATSEQLGSLQRSQTYPRSADGGVLLTADERRAVRKAAGGSAISSVPLGSTLSGDESDDLDLLPLDEVWPGS